MTLPEFVQDEVFDEIFNSNQLLSMDVSTLFVGGVRKKPVNSDSILELTSYRERALRLTWQRENVRLEIGALNDKCRLIKRMPFRVAAKNEFGEVIGRRLKSISAVTYLMRAGYFDTDYNDYLGFFYEGSLTQGDKNLILALRQGEMPEVSTLVNNPGLVLGKLDHELLEGGRGLIAGLVDYMCSQYIDPDADSIEGQTDDPFAGALDATLKMARLSMDRLAEVIDSLLPGPNTRVLIQAIHRTDPLLLIDLFTFSTRFQASGPRQAFVCAVFSSLTPEQVQALSDAGILDSLAGLEDVTQVMPLLAHGNDTWEWLRNNPVHFYNLSDTTPADDLKQLLSWGCVAPRLEMLRLICFSSDADGEGDGPVTFRRLQALQLDGIDSLLSLDPNEFVGQLLSQEGMLDESSESLSALLAAVGGKSNWVAPLLERTSCQLRSLESVPTQTWELLLNVDRISNRADAVWTYFLQPTVANSEDDYFIENDGVERFNFDKTILAGFIERHVDVLKPTLWERHPDRHRELQQYLLRTEVFTNATLAKLLSTTDLKSMDVLSTVPAVRWEMLVTSKFLPYSVEILKIIQNSARQHEAAYLARHGRVQVSLEARRSE
ncbi:hypothetical protein LRS56_10480 [Pseudomonas poae]|nr:hypothetical protein LRS56_10480 [Pseudomonas poae]